MGLSLNVKEAFNNAFEFRCVTLLVTAYQSSITYSDFSPDWIENDFTSMIDRYIDQNPLRLEWNIHCAIEHHLHKNVIHNNKGYANQENRIDMRLTNICCKQEFRYYVEAKRLKESDTTLHKRYIETGIDNYISEKYPHGILVGYLVEGSISKTIANICSILCKNNRSSEVLTKKDYILHNHYYESVHSGFGTIKHLIFDFTI